MTEDDKSASAATPADARRLARLAQIEAEQEHGRRLVERYGRDDRRPRFAVVAYGNAKRRRWR